ncbi:MAG: hypothetical protein ACK56I_36655, partial [bacterium]
PCSPQKDTRPRRAMKRIRTIEPLRSQLLGQSPKPLPPAMLPFAIEHDHIVDQGISRDEFCQRGGTEHRDPGHNGRLLEHLDNRTREEDISEKPFGHQEYVWGHDTTYRSIK